MIKAIVTDIEGTTSSISFVHEVLFPYAYENLPGYVRAHAGDLENIFVQVRDLEGQESLSTEEIISTLLRWIKEDRKATPLKTLQGFIWDAGFGAGVFKAHVYPDSAPALQRWFDKGLKLYVYSSGSVAAQKLLFGHSEAGDLTVLFSGYFDTVTGPKMEAESYTKIAAAISCAPRDVLFLSDNEKEIDAALVAGMQAILVDRDGNKPLAKNYHTVRNFDEITIREMAA